MQTKRIKTIRRKLKEGHYDRPEIVAPGAWDPAKGLIGQQHAQETQSRWSMMDVEDAEKERCLAREPARRRETASAFGR